MYDLHYRKGLTKHTRKEEKDGIKYQSGMASRLSDTLVTRSLLFFVGRRTPRRAPPSPSFLDEDHHHGVLVLTRCARQRTPRT